MDLRLYEIAEDLAQPSWWDKLRDWWAGRRKADCDQCNQTFHQHDLGATSGDWWLCSKCWDKLHKDMEKQRANSSS